MSVCAREKVKELKEETTFFFSCKTAPQKAKEDYSRIKKT